MNETEKLNFDDSFPSELLDESEKQHGRKNTIIHILGLKKTQNEIKVRQLD